MLRVGLTGGIGAGKSFIAHIFSEKGFPVYNADSEAARLMNEDAELRKQLMDTFGEQSYDSDGKLNRKYIADIVFHDKEALKTINAIVHPSIIKDFDTWCRRQSQTVVMMESAIIFEAELDDYFDYVICVTASEETRLRRVITRDNTTEEAVKARMSKQMDEKKKVAQSDFSISTDDESTVKKRVEALAEILKVIALTAGIK